MQESTDIALATDKLCVSRGGQRVLTDLSFEVRKGEVFVLLGGNGAGKSTTLLTFIGLLKPDSGQALVLGSSAIEKPKEVRSQVAYLPENAALYEHLDAWQNIRYFLSLANAERSDDAIANALDAVALPIDARLRRLDDYSKGMRQKVSIALALLRETPILMLDEPTSGLDPVAIVEFNRLVETLRERGVTVLMVTHDLLGACQVRARVGLISNGRSLQLSIREMGTLSISRNCAHCSCRGAQHEFDRPNHPCRVPVLASLLACCGLGGHIGGDRDRVGADLGEHSCRGSRAARGAPGRGRYSFPEPAGAASAPHGALRALRVPCPAAIGDRGSGCRCVHGHIGVPRRAPAEHGNVRGG